VKVRGSIARIPGIPNVSEDVPRKNKISGPEAPVSIEVCIVVHLSSGADHVDHLAAELVRADTDYDAVRRRKHWRATRGKDVDALMCSASAARKTP